MSDNTEISKINIVDFFDPYNIKHIKAYKTMNETGVWPKGFIPNHIVFGQMWLPSLCMKMADAWIDHQLTGNDAPADIMSK
jgi:hypothetical protein